MIVNLIKSKIIRKERVSEGLSRSGGPVDMFMRVAFIRFIEVRKPAYCGWHISLGRGSRTV